MDQAPSYQSAEVPLSGDWTCVVSGDGTGLVSVGVAGAALYAVRLEAGQAIDLPEAPLLHVFVTTGGVQLGERALVTDDAARLTDEPGRTLTAASPAEVLVWAFAGPR
jgi:redox-sensitive bicupin YhaK (pirin superfamily)